MVYGLDIDDNFYNPLNMSEADSLRDNITPPLPSGRWAFVVGTIGRHLTFTVDVTG